MRINSKFIHYLLFILIFFGYVSAFSPAMFAVVFVPYILLVIYNEDKGNKVFYVTMALMIVLGAAFISVFATVVYLLLALIPAFILAAVRQKGDYDWKAVILSPLPAFIISAFALYFFPEQRSALEAIFAERIEMLLSPLVSSDASRLADGSMMMQVYLDRAEYAKLFVGLMPALFYTSIALIIFVTEKVYYKVPPNRILPLPDALLALVVVAGACYIGLKMWNGAAIPEHTLKIIGGNAILISGTLYFTRGFDIVKFYVSKWRLPLFLKIFIYILIVLEMFLAVAVAALGILSVYKNLIREEKESEAKSGR